MEDGILVPKLAKGNYYYFFYIFFYLDKYISLPTIIKHSCILFLYSENSLNLLCMIYQQTGFLAVIHE